MNEGYLYAHLDTKKPSRRFAGTVTQYFGKQSENYSPTTSKSISTTFSLPKSMLALCVPASNLKLELVNEVWEKSQLITGHNGFATIVIRLGKHILVVGYILQVQGEGLR